MSLALLVSSSLWSLSKADSTKCNYYIEEDYSAPVQLDTCAWRGQDLSYGYWCATEYNNTVFEEQMVVTLRYQADDCPGGFVEITEDNEDIVDVHSITPCDDRSCHCDGTPALCETSLTYNCNDSFYLVEEYVTNLCHDLGVPGSASVLYECDNQNVHRTFNYVDSTCTGDLSQTPGPTPSPLGVSFDDFCYKTTCPGDSEESASSDSGGGGGVIAVVVILGICALLVCMVGVWYVMKKRKKADQYFDDNTGTGF